jgi:hypothetical protein
MEMAILMIFETGIPMAPVALRKDEIGCGKLNMATYETEIPLSFQVR